MKIRSLFAAATIAGIGLAGLAQGQVKNPSFEDGTGTSADHWTKFDNTYREPIAPRTGSYTMKMFGNFWGSFNVSGCFQDFAISPGQQASASVYGFNWSGDPMSADNWAILKVVYRDAANNDLVAAESMPLNKDSWVDHFQLMAAALGPAPANTHHGSIFLLFLQPGFAGGSAFFDDVALTVGTGRTVSGTVNFQNVTGTPPDSIGIEFRLPGTTTVVGTANAQLDGNGNFTVLAPSPNGIYDIAAKVTTFLRAKKSVNTTFADVTGVTLDMVNGDVDGDNVVSVFDYIRLSDSFDRAYGDTGFDWAADLDLDGVISVFDYIILSDNFDKAGAD